jgi:hypothetical protein
VSRGADWFDANQAYLTEELATLRVRLERHADGDPVADEQPAPGHEGSYAIDVLAESFGLSAFERSVVLLCAGVELDLELARACAAAQPESDSSLPTFSLALAALPGAHWSALPPWAPLRQMRLVEVGHGSTLTTSPLRIDERVLHFIVGLGGLDERLRNVVQPLNVDVPLVSSHDDIARSVASVWQQDFGGSPAPVVQLCGADAEAKRAIVAAACARLGAGASVAAARSIPSDALDAAALARLWDREGALSNGVLLVDAGDEVEGAAAAALGAFADASRVALVIGTRDRRRSWRRATVAFEVAKPSAAEQRNLWEQGLGSTANGSVDALVAQFDLPAHVVHEACLEARVARGSGRDPAGAARAACLARIRPRLDDLAQRIRPAARWEDLVLPEAQHHQLREIALHVRHRLRVYEEWGFARRDARGFGISALFAGPSGTGKTFTAEILASELGLDCYRVDLSQVVNKYIGETEKNLRRVFDAAEDGGTLLLFDEADALFGRRSEVKDSHDRYANIEVSYLLQRMETYRGLAILTTNAKEALDQAFTRRLRFVVHFSFPDAQQRAAIWRRVFPTETPLGELDFDALAGVNISGAVIRNVAVSAACIAAATSDAVEMEHVYAALRSELAKLERSWGGLDLVGTA